MTRKLSPVLAAALLGLFLTGSLYGAVHGRLVGKVVDEDGKPIQGVDITIRGTNIDVEVKRTTDKKGRFSVVLINGNRTYEILLEKEGYKPLQEPLDLLGMRGRSELDATLRKTWTLVERTVAPAGSVPSVTLDQPPVGDKKAIGFYNEGATAYNAGAVDAAIAKFEEALEVDPELVAAYSVLGAIYLQREEYQKAAQAAEKLLALEPGNVAGLQIRYDVYSALGEKDRAAEALDALAEVARSPETAARVYNEGVSAVRAGDRDTAIARFELALEVDPTLKRAYSAVASIYVDRKDYEKALEKTDRLLELEPENIEAQSIRYDAYRALGREEDAQRALEALQAGAPEAVAEAFYKQGEEHFNAGRIPKAIAALERTVEAQPGHAKAHYLLGLCYVHSEQNDKAGEHFRRFLELAPDDPDAETARAMLQYLTQPS